MLILTRRMNQTVMIGDNIAVTISGVKGRQVRLSIEAPRDIPIYREEIYERIQENIVDTSSHKR